MKTFRSVRIAAVLATALLMVPAMAASKADLETALSHDGLAKITVKGVDLAFVRPGVTFAGYNKVKLDPIEVAFSKNWNPKRTGSNFRLNATERENIRAGLAKVVNDEFVKELTDKSSYKVVTDSGEDVLRVKVNVINVYVNAPDTMSAGRSRTYTVSAGEMTLFMELYDSETGQVLARVVDRRESRNAGMLQLSTSVTNIREAQDIASGWARILRNGLDRAHDIGKK